MRGRHDRGNLSVGCLLLLIIFASGCCSQKTASIDTHTTVKDSTVVSFEPVDTLISVPEDKVKVVVPVSELSEIPLVKTGNRTRLSIAMVDEVITAECRADELKQEIELLQKTIDHYKKTETTTTETIIEEVKYVPWLVEVLAWIGGIALALVGFQLFVYVIKPKFL